MHHTIELDISLLIVMRVVRRKIMHAQHSNVIQHCRQQARSIDPSFQHPPSKVTRCCISDLPCCIMILRNVSRSNANVMQSDVALTVAARGSPCNNIRPWSINSEELRRNGETSIADQSPPYASFTSMHMRALVLAISWQAKQPQLACRIKLLSEIEQHTAHFSAVNE